MPDFFKGGVFVGAAVAVGLLAAFIVPPMVVGRGSTKSEPAAAPAPLMPDVVGRTLDDAERALRRRDISYVTEEDDVLGVVLPSVWEVCETQPGAGQRVRSSARLRAAMPGTCALG